MTFQKLIVWMMEQDPLSETTAHKILQRILSILEQRTTKQIPVQTQSYGQKTDDT